MKRTLSPESTREISRKLREALEAFARQHPGEGGQRQPVHTVYGGAHLFKADSAQKLGALGLRALDEYAPDAVTFARAIGVAGADQLSASQISNFKAQMERDPGAARRNHPSAWLAETIYRRVREKLEREAVEDFRLDYEDGYGNRPDAEEDGHAVSGAAEVAAGLAAGTLPPFIGIRIKPFSDELRERSIRTLDLFVTALVEKCGGKLPPNFVVTLPKVTIPEQVTALVDLFDVFEPALRLERGALKFELMVETPQSIIGKDGSVPLPRLVQAGRGRCVAAHFGTYDYTASCNITAAHQHMNHIACDFARHVMQVGLAGAGVWLSDGATNVMPVPVHRAPKGGTLSPEQVRENQAVVHRSWRLHVEHIHHSLELGFYQGWDLHPAQLPTRYAAVYSFFLKGLEAAAERLKNFVEKAAQATLVGDVFDDAATGQGLLNFFLRAINCGAIPEDEAASLTGLSLTEIRTRSFVKILKGRAT